MKPEKAQFPDCDSCGKPIIGKVNTVNTRGLGSTQSFHSTPEECESAELRPFARRRSASKLDKGALITGTKDRER
jgi:hypothetical protein